MRTRPKKRRQMIDALWIVKENVRCLLTRGVDVTARDGLSTMAAVWGFEFEHVPLLAVYHCCRGLENFQFTHSPLPRDTAFNAFVTFTCEVEYSPFFMGILGPRLNAQYFCSHGHSSTKLSRHFVVCFGSVRNKQTDHFFSRVFRLSLRLRSSYHQLSCPRSSP